MGEVIHVALIFDRSNRVPYARMWTHIPRLGETVHLRNENISGTVMEVRWMEQPDGSRPQHVVILLDKLS